MMPSSAYTPEVRKVLRAQCISFNPVLHMPPIRSTSEALKLCEYSCQWQNMLLCRGNVSALVVAHVHGKRYCCAKLGESAVTVTPSALLVTILAMYFTQLFAECCGQQCP